jgi:ubiquinone/menaquinone biosynthesis C-methylase UbiE
MQTTSRDDLRAQLHGTWASVAPSWREHADYADSRGAACTARLLELSAPRPGERVLELACGAGGVGIAAAELVGPAGEVVLSDVAAEMTAIAAARAATLGLGNLRALPLDLDDLDQPDEAYDVVLCREGLMFALDPAHALAEIRRVLRPGARLVVELLHRDRLVRGFAEQDWRLLGEGRLLLEQRTFDAATGVAQTTQTLIDGAGGRESRSFSVRVYSATELVAMLGRAGFADVRTYGDLEGSPFGVDTRLVAVAVRP